MGVRRTIESLHGMQPLIHSDLAQYFRPQGGPWRDQIAITRPADGGPLTKSPPSPRRGAMPAQLETASNSGGCVGPVEDVAQYGSAAELVEFGTTEEFSTASTKAVPGPPTASIPKSVDERRASTSPTNSEQTKSPAEQSSVVIGDDDHSGNAHPDVMQNVQAFARPTSPQPNEPPDFLLLMEARDGLFRHPPNAVRHHSDLQRARNRAAAL
jgi:hypothetical protein